MDLSGGLIHFTGNLHGLGLLEGKLAGVLRLFLLLVIVGVVGLAGYFIGQH